VTEHLQIVATKREAADLAHLIGYLSEAGPQCIRFAPEVAAVRESLDDSSFMAALVAAAKIRPIIESYQRAVHNFGMLVIPQIEQAVGVFIVGGESYPFEIDPEPLPRVVSLFRAISKHHTDAVTCDPEDCFAIGVQSFCDKLDLASGSTLAGIVVSQDVPDREKLES
jgi:hypothetical protein